MKIDLTQIIKNSFLKFQRAIYGISQYLLGRHYLYNVNCSTTKFCLILLDTLRKKKLQSP